MSVPEGGVRIHLYDVKEVLRPRGTLEKESLSLTVAEFLESALRDVTNPEYGDSMPIDEAVRYIMFNMGGEVAAAVRRFSEFALREQERGLRKTNGKTN